MKKILWKYIILIIYVFCFSFITSIYSVADSIEETTTGSIETSENDVVVQPMLVEVKDTSVTLVEIEGYEYSNGGEVWQSSPVFEDLKVNSTYLFYQRQRLTENGEPGGISEALEIKTLKSTVAAPGVPVLKSRTDTSIVLDDATRSYQFSLDGETWQSSCIFNNLTPWTNYTIYQRIWETDTTYASEKGPGLVVKTKKAAAEGVKPSVNNISDTVIELDAVKGYEFSIDGENWGDESTFTDLEPLTVYMVMQRLKETDDQVSGIISSIDVKTLKADTVPVGYIGIYTKKDLNDVRNKLDAKYILMNNLEFAKEDFEASGDFYNNGEGWVPIGTNSNNAFSGVFNGNGHYIEGIQIDVQRDKSGYWGLFGYNAGTIRNMGLVNQRIKVKVASDVSGVGTNDVGAVSGYNEGVITDCYASGIVESIVVGDYVGNRVGGIVGWNYSGTVSNCYNMSDIRCRSNRSDRHIYAGGICGIGTAKNCYNIGNIDNSSRTTAYGTVAAVSPSNSNSGCYAIDCVVKDLSLKGQYDGKVSLLSDDKMRQAENFSEFDFVNTWELNGESDYPYPSLKGVLHKEKAENTVDFADGNGTVYNPYLISTKEHLTNVNKYLGSNYKMTTDIVFSPDDFTTMEWTPIGITNMECFYGQFDGNGHVVSGLSMDITRDDYVYAGLFGTSDGVIKNLGLVNGDYKINIKIPEAESDMPDTCVGGIVARSTGIISNCYNTNRIVVIGEMDSGSHIKAGGISGTSEVIKNCYNNGTVIASGDFVNTGGISGKGDKIECCYNTGAISQIDNSSAGASSITQHITTVSCYALPNREADDRNTIFLTEEQMRYQESFEGFDFVNVWEMKENYPYPSLKKVGHVLGEENISDFAGGTGERYNPYVIKNREHLDNIMKYKDASFLLDCDIDYEGNVWETVGTSQIDAFRGSIDGNGHSIKNLRMENQADDSVYGGFIGINEGAIKNISFLDCSVQYNGSIDGDIYQGMLCGRNKIQGSIENCRIYNMNMEISSKNGGVSVGGAVGYNVGIVKDIAVTGNLDVQLTISAAGHIGGVVGENQGHSTKVSQCYTNIKLSGYHDCKESAFITWGGIVGYNYNITATHKKAYIKDCFSSGIFRVVGTKASKGSSYLGGIAGYNAGYYTVIENVYSCSEISESATDSGCICGNSESKYRENWYYLAGINRDYYGIKLNSDEMSDSSNFYGFDFENIWTMDYAKDNGYRFPQLKGNPYEGELAKYPLSEYSISLEKSAAYTGEEIKPKVTISYLDAQLIEGQDYTVKYRNNVELGTASVVVKGMGSYTGTLESSFTIIPADITGFKAKLERTKYIYEGTAIEPVVVVEGLTEGEDYFVSYSGNGKIGTGKAYVTGKGNYKGIISLEFTIVKETDLSVMEISGISKETYVYTGNYIRPKVEISHLGVQLLEGCDYTVEYYNNVDVGTASAVITGLGEYKGTQKFEFTIGPADITDVHASLEHREYIYEGTAIEPTVYMQSLVEGTDYTVTYSDNDKVGIGRVLISGTGNYKGRILLEFVIKKQNDISIMTVTGISEKPYIYTGKEIRPEIKLGKLEAGIDFEVLYENNVDIGSATVKVFGIGEYEGMLTSSFTIVAPSVPELETLTASLHQKYDSIRVSWKKLENVTGYKILYCIAGRDNWKERYTKNSNIMLTDLVDGKKYKIQVIPCMEVGDYCFRSFGKYVQVYTLKKMTKPAIKKYSSTKIKITWKNISGETGYQISRTTKKNKTKIVSTIKTTRGKSKVLKVSKGKKYYYKIRAYRSIMVDGKKKKVYGPWSKAVSFKN